MRPTAHYSPKLPKSMAQALTFKQRLILETKLAKLDFSARTVMPNGRAIIALLKGGGPHPIIPLYLPNTV